MSSELVPGTVFAGRYRIVRLIAAGGMGAVYEVVHIETERRRALKVMLPHVLNSPDLRERFQREAKVAAHVESDFIVDVFDAGYDDATSMPFLVMELLRGEELGKRVKRLGRLPPAEVVATLHQASLALDKTHRATIVHRDLKPENLFLTEREDGAPRVKVLDFGIAKVVAESTTQGATQSIGTPLYMAPEQFNPNARLTGAADLYALAMVAYTLLVGSAYWGEETRGGNVFALAAVAIFGPKEPASARAARRGMTLPPTFDAWFARATLPDPAQRFATGVEMTAALAQALGLLPPGRAPQTSMESASGIQPALLSAVPTPVSASAPGPGPTTAPVFTPAPVSTPALSGPVPTMGTIYTPASVPTTAPGTSTTRPIPTRSAMPLAIGAAVALGVLVGLGVFVLTRKGDAPAPGAQASASTHATPAATAAPIATPSAATPEPVVSVAESVTASAAPPRPPEKPAATAASVTTKPAAAAPATGPKPQHHIYTRE